MRNFKILLSGLLLVMIVFAVSCAKKVDRQNDQPYISPEIQKKVDEILKKERDSILKANGIIAGKPCYDCPLPPCDMTSTGSISGTINSITGVFKVNNNSITSFSFSMTGVQGTVTQIGGITQAVYQGVVTYQVVLANTWTFKGVKYTQNFLIYGNIYNCEASIGGMVLSS